MNSNTKSTPIHVLIAHKSDADASAITQEIHRTTDLQTVITRTTNKSHCLQLMETLTPNVVIADYDFGLFPFINELRDKNSDIPFIIISELELLQNAPKEGLNIYILKSSLARLPSWLTTLNAAGMLSDHIEPKPAQIHHFQKAVERRHHISAPAPLPVRGGQRHVSSSASPVQDIGIMATDKVADPLRRWTDDIQKKMQGTDDGFHASHHRATPLFPEKEQCD